jgi:K+-transporting ATPase ATPase A chain
VLLLAATHASLGAHLATVFTGLRHWRVERLTYPLCGVDPDKEQPWTVYAASVGAFSLLSFVLLLTVTLAQGWLPLHHGESMHLDTAVNTAVNTAVSFVANTNWQSYAGEAGTLTFVQAVGLTVHNFASAAVGIAVVAALVRAIARHESRLLGNFWVDLTRTVVRVLLPIAAVAAVVLIRGGVIQNLTGPTDVTGVTRPPSPPPAGWSRRRRRSRSSAPTVAGSSGDRRQGHAILAFMTVLWAGSVALTTWAEAAGGGMEGKEARFGIWSPTVALIPVGGADTAELTNAAYLSSVADETPEGRSIV